MLIDDIIINLLIILFLYLVIFVIYYAVSVFLSTKKNQIGIEKKYLAQDLPGNLIVIVYALEGENSVVELANMLKNQRYPKDNYQVHVLFDNVTSETPDLVANLGGIKVWRINKGTVMGKDEALSWLLERLISFRNVNAFVFLDANRKVSETFLSSVNTALFSNDIIVPATEYIVEKGNIIAAVKNQAIKYINRVFNTSRAILKLINPIDSGAVAIKQEVLELIRCVDFKDSKTEYMYTIFLASKGYTPVFAPDVKSKINFEDEKHLTFKDKCTVIKYGFSKLFESNGKVFEFLLTFLKPALMLIILLYIGFFAFLYNFEVKNMFFYDIKYIMFSALALIVIFLISLITSADAKINPALLVMNPIYSILEKIFPSKKKETKEKTNEQEENHIARGNGVPVQVTDGQNILNCTIELKNTGSGMKAVFRYKAKTLESETYPSAKQAIGEISSKIYETGLKLQVCSVCAHFGFKPDSDGKSQKGLCSQKDKMTGDISPETSLLDTCEHFNLLSELNNVVEFPQNNDNNNEN